MGLTLQSSKRQYTANYFAHGTMQTMGHETIEWEAPEYLYRPKGPRWFWGLGGAGLILLVIAFLFDDNFLSVLVIMLALTAILLFAQKKPRVIHCEITKVGITIDKRFFPFSSLSAFGVDADEQNPLLFLTSQKLLMPMIIVPLNDQNPGDIQDFLRNYLPEEKLEEPLSHKILEYFGI